MVFVLENKPVVVVGGGHAGIEAILACSRAGVPSVLVTMNKDAIGRLSCNPAIGGLAKTHLVKEIDALGGVMGLAADMCALQYKTLNKTKGRAVWSTRAQVDKIKYPSFIQGLIKNNKHISVVEDELVDINQKQGSIAGVSLKKLGPVRCSALIVSCGTFSNGLIHVGKKTYSAGRIGEKNTKTISAFLKKLGHTLLRLKTGTPPRISLSSINLKKVDVSSGEDLFFPFSLFSNRKPFKQEACYSINTNDAAHSIIEKNLKHSAMFSGKIKGVGPRYCPSIEDKIHRFSDRSSHHLFLEPEWSGSDQIYVNGFSTSLPAQTQLKALSKIPALKNVKFIRPGYAIEYDVVPPRELKSSLESKKIKGLFLAGQVNGTSGYEEAAAQGLIAGINASLFLSNRQPLVLSRTNSYIGVLIDDLITSALDEPYRMFTSRAEHRLFLRPDNCYTRLFQAAKKNSLLTKKQLNYYSSYQKTKNNIEAFVFLEKVKLKNKTVRLQEYIKRPGAFLVDFSKNYKKLPFFKRAVFEIETKIKYSGYIENELERIQKNKSLEDLTIPAGFNFSKVSGLSNESQERLNLVSPQTLGQASRIFGIRPTDITLLGVFLKKHHSKVSRETKHS